MGHLSPSPTSSANGAKALSSSYTRDSQQYLIATLLSAKSNTRETSSCMMMDEQPGDIIVRSVLSDELN